MPGRISYVATPPSEARSRPSDRAERRQPGAHEGCEIGTRHRPEPEERPVMRDGRCRITAVVSDDRQVVVRAGMPRVDGNGTLQEIPRPCRAPGRSLDESQVD